MRTARVALVGCGATGSALAGLLARAGVGTLRIIDRDYVEPSNLQRQSLFDENDAAESLPKAIAAARQIAAFNSQIVVEPKVDDLVPANIEALLEGIELILDGTDNFETRYLINDYAVDRSLPWIYSAAVGSYAVTLNVVPGANRMPGLHFPGLSARHGRNLRDFGHPEFGGKFGGVGRRNRSDENSGRRNGQP